MIIGIGTDVVSNARIEKIWQRFSHRFVQRILAEEEYAAFEGATRKVAFLAKRFAVKEATAKALGYGFRSGVQFRDIYIQHSVLGKPELRLKAMAQTIATALGMTHAHVSITDEHTMAQAFVVLEKNTI